MHIFAALFSVFIVLAILCCKTSEGRPELIFESNDCEYEGRKLGSGVSITLNQTCVKLWCERGRVRREECPHIDIANDPYCGTINRTGFEFPDCCPLYYCEEGNSS
uniref:Putative conserved secreted protein n=1 Tax=Amblyomma tuberculatum TaxID=48802 RepID=A0A6M2E1Q1_9ACAR